jgi:hypothetical protein
MAKGKAVEFTGVDIGGWDSIFPSIIFEEQLDAD